MYLRASDPNIRERPRVLEYTGQLSGNIPVGELLLLEGGTELRLEVVHLYSEVRRMLRWRIKVPLTIASTPI